MILTKAPYIFDPNGEQDREEITSSYKAPEGEKNNKTPYTQVGNNNFTNIIIICISMLSFKRIGNREVDPVSSGTRHRNGKKILLIALGVQGGRQI